MKTIICLAAIFIAAAVYHLCVGVKRRAKGFFSLITPCPRANVSSAQHALLCAKKLLSPGELGGRVRYAYGKFTQGAADGAIGDIVSFTKLPNGATIVPHLCKAYFSAGNDGATMKFGITGSDAALAAATSIAAIGSVALDASAASGGTLKTTAEVDVIGTNAVAAIKAGQVITAHIAYVID